MAFIIVLDTDCIEWYLSNDVDSVETNFFFNIHRYTTNFSARIFLTISVLSYNVESIYISVLDRIIEKSFVSN